MNSALSYSRYLLLRCISASASAARVLQHARAGWCMVLAAGCALCVRGHMHPLHTQPGTQKFLNPRTGRAPVSRVLIGWTNGLLMSQPELIQAGTSA
eukprot:COSAG01_NODE_7076_length_3364_cov_9.983767_1_plen_96_part_10